MADATLEFIGTATTLLRLGPFVVLTDPNFLHRGQRAYLGKGFSSRRRTDPSLQPAELPDVDLVLLSHLHGDHFDRVARAELSRDLPVLSTTAAARRLRQWGFDGAAGMTTWDSTTISAEGHQLTITAVPGQHARGPVRSILPPVMGSILELTRPGRTSLRVYVSGDTLYFPWLSSIVERTGPIDAAVVHLGGTRLLGLLVTMDDRQGADLVELMRPSVVVPVHYDDYGVFKSPLADFVSTFASRQLPSALRVVRRGETVSLEPA